MDFCPSAAGNTALRWAKRTLLPIRSRKFSPPLGKTGHFSHPQPNNQFSVRGTGQQPGARRAFRRAPRSARAVAAGSRSLRRRCPAPVYPLLTPAFSLPSTAFAPPNPQNSPCVPQNQSFWCPRSAKTARRTPKPVILVSRARENCPLCPKTCPFGVPDQ